jgi:hypothetical protein
MMNEQISELREIASWFREQTGKGANVGVNFHAFSFEREKKGERIEYSFWADGFISKYSENLEELISCVKSFKNTYEIYKDLLS